MFAIEPYPASRHVVKMRDGKTTMAWEPCQVIGARQSGDDLVYVVEVHTGAGEFFLDTADLIRREPQ